MVGSAGRLVALSRLIQTHGQDVGQFVIIGGSFRVEPALLSRLNFLLSNTNTRASTLSASSMEHFRGKVAFKMSSTRSTSAPERVVDRWKT